MAVVALGAWSFNAWKFYSQIKNPPAPIVSNTPKPVPYLPNEKIIIDTPLSGEKLKSPLVITGRAKTWYFEGSFPIELNDMAGNVLGTGIAQAEGDWMSADFVPFTATINFKKPQVDIGTLTFKKDNPSGLPKFDEHLTVPVTFDLSAWSVVNIPTSDAPCQVGGCSGQLCTDEPGMATTCEWREEYACYKTATCARGTNGKCGWVKTETLNNCLAASGKN